MEGAMADKINPESLKFLLKLDQAAAMAEKKTPKDAAFLRALYRAVLGADKEQLVSLASDVIDKSHDGRSFSERRSRDLIVNPASIGMGATFGLGHALMGANLSTKDKLYMVMNEYINLSVGGNAKASKDRALAKFCHEFAEKYPRQFGAENAENKMPLKMNGGLNMVNQSREVVM